jgi:acyl-coenzyme A synthetase/AMP-(fatty) acid ligase
MLSHGIEPNDLVAFYLQNSAQFMMLWLATTYLGAGPAFINYNLEGKALLHCTDVCQSKLIIIEDEAGCKSRIAASRSDLEAKGTRVVILDQTLINQIESSPVELVGDEYRENLQPGFPACLIYTR